MNARDRLSQRREKTRATFDQAAQEQRFITSCGCGTSLWRPCKFPRGITMGVPAKANSIPVMHVDSVAREVFVIRAWDAMEMRWAMYERAKWTLVERENTTRILPRDKSLSAKFRHSKNAALLRAALADANKKLLKRFALRRDTCALRHCVIENQASRRTKTSQCKSCRPIRQECRAAFGSHKKKWPRPLHGSKVAAVNE
jgi:hypothetical protein